MGVKIVASKLEKLFQQVKGYYLLSSFLAINLIVLILSPQNWYAWGFFCLLLLRLFIFKKKALGLVTIFLLLLTFVIVFFQEQQNQTVLDETLDYASFHLNPEQYKVDGNLLTGTAQIATEDGFEKVSFLYKIQSEEEKAIWESLDELIYFDAHMKLSKPNVARNEHQFDYRNYLYRNRIHWTATIEKIENYKQDVRPQLFLSRLRLKWIRFLRKKIPDGKTLEYLLAILFNQTKDMDYSVMESYRKIGVIHLFSISGMHIHFLIVVLKYLLLRIGITRERTSPLVLIGIVAYGFLIGNGVGIFRAISTNSLLLLAKIFKKDLYAKDAFALTILFALWLNPYIVFSLAFQLSYGLSGILYFLSKHIEEINKNVITKDLFLSFIMTTFSFLFLSYHYFEVTWLGMFVNILFSFFFSICFFPVLWVISICAFLNLPSFFYSFIITGLDSILLYLEKFTNFLAGKNWLLMVTGRQKGFSYLLLAVSIICFFISIEQNKKLIKSFVLLSITFFIFYLTPYLNPNGKIIMLDVGQGDSFLFISPFHRNTFLIDTGGRMSFGNEAEWQRRINQDAHAKNLVSSIKAQGVRELDAIFLTHSDVDHLGNLKYLAKEIPVSTIFFSKGMEKTAKFQEAVSDMNQSKVVFTPLQAPERVRVGEIVFEILSPLKEGEGTNDDSLVLLTKISDLIWLFTGDMEEKGEELLIKRYPNLQVDVLKVGHHGSKTSTTETFVKQVSPRVAWISVGDNNSYGHPNSEVIERIENEGITIYRTDKQGAIHFIYRRNKNQTKIMVQ